MKLDVWYTDLQMRVLRFVVLVTLATALILVVFYVVPTLIELKLASRAGPFIAYVLVGDSIGCVAIPTLMKIRWRNGLALYVALTTVETLLVESGIVPAQRLAWVTDLVPALVLVGFTTLAISVSYPFRDVASSPRTE